MKKGVNYFNETTLCINARQTAPPLWEFAYIEALLSGYDVAKRKPFSQLSPIGTGVRL